MSKSMIRMGIIAICLMSQGCVALPIISTVASLTGTYMSYRAATATKVEVLSRDCLILTEPLYMSRESVLIAADKRKIAAQNMAREKICVNEPAQ